MLIGEPIRIRRELLKLSIRGAARKASKVKDDGRFSETLWRQMESGSRQLRKGFVVTVSPKPSSVIALCDVLHWQRDSLDLMAAGGDPVIVAEVSPSPDLEDRVALLEQQLVELDRRVTHSMRLGADLANEALQDAESATMTGDDAGPDAPNEEIESDQ